MAKRFDGRVMLVTGAGSGIGRATALRLASEGAAVGALDRDSEGALRTSREASALGGHSIPLSADIGAESDVERAMMLVSRNLGRLSGLVSCAGIFHPGDGRLAADVDLESFMAVLNVNLIGTFLAVKYSLPHLVEQQGALVTIASTAALRGHGFGSGYTASKGGVDAFTRLVATQYGPKGVRANCICPGSVDTPMTAGVHTTPEAIERAKKEIPLQKVAQPEQIASVAAFLLSDDASHMTGQTLAVDGGTTMAG
ncbi:MAG TPA: SDR family NAD(P)-dependent oxidoreductase [Acidimicrobiia bacterium]|jgi:NAD(P)-dependent dehydrogenase (short-subunit alcohol dehydrogenase family)